MDERGELRLNEPALVVALLRPRIREPDEHLLHARRREPAFEHIERIGHRDPDVFDPGFVAAGEQAADAGRIDLDSEEIPLGLTTCECGQGLAGSESDLHRARRTTAEQTVQVQRIACEVEQVPATVLREGAALRLGHPPGPDDEAAHRAPPPGAVRIVRNSDVVQVNVPSSGEDALA